MFFKKNIKSMDKQKDDELLVEYVQNYYKNMVRTSSIGVSKIKYYKSLRGYFKHSTRLSDIKEQDFNISDYKCWERILNRVKSGKDPVANGGLKFKYNHFEDIVSKRTFFNVKKKFLELNLLIETPFKDYYILNPEFIIKLYTPE